MTTNLKWMPALLLFGTAGVAHADTAVRDTDDMSAQPDPYSYAWREDRLASRVGIGLTLGGGASGFTDQSTRTALDSNAAGLWSFRAAFGTHIPIGIELGYTGTALSLNQLSTTNPTLVSTTAEAALRYNILPHYRWNPYIFAGAGWQRYDVTGGMLSRSSTGIKDSDQLAVFPMGVGLGYRNTSGFIADARGTLRLAQDSNLVLDSNGNNANLHTWEASGSVGYEF